MHWEAGRWYGVFAPPEGREDAGVPDPRRGRAPVAARDSTGEGYGPDGDVRFEGKKAEAPHAAPLLELATILLGCNNAHLVQEDGAWKVIGDPTEGAMLAAGRKAGGNQERLDQELPKQHEFPFDSDRKRSTVIRRMPDGRLRAFTNGAPGVLLPLCTNLYTSTGIRPMMDEDRHRHGEVRHGSHQAGVGHDRHR